MALKTKTITLSSGWMPSPDQGNSYRVERVTDSIEYTPGQMLHQNEVRTLCVSDRWKVTVIPSRGAQS